MATVDAFSTTVLPADVVDDADKSAIIAALVVSVVMLCLLVSVMLFAYCRRLRLVPEGWRGRICRLCRCLKVGGGGEEVAEMGYLPANITVNQGAVQQGVPDIFLRNSHSGRISIADPASCSDTDVISREISRDSSSAGETSGSWAEYLRRATLRASRAATGRRTAARAMTDSGMPVAASDAASSTDLTPMPVAASDAASSTDLTPKADPQ